MSHADFLNALAAVCEAAERIPVPRYHPHPPPPPPPQTCYQGYAEAGDTAMGPSYQPPIPHYPLSQPDYSGFYSPPAPIDCCSSVVATPSPSFASAQSSIQNNCVFQQFLDATWPEKTLRRGSAVIRSTLYEKIAETLRGGESTARFKHWVKKSEFFLMQKVVPGMGYGACLAVPAVRATRGAGAGMSATRHPHKLVARLEDFSEIISTYHNDQKGHSGIRRTYAMVRFYVAFFICIRTCFWEDLVYYVLGLVSPWVHVLLAVCAISLLRARMPCQSFLICK